MNENELSYSFNFNSACPTWTTLPIPTETDGVKVYAIELPNGGAINCFVEVKDGKVVNCTPDAFGVNDASRY